MGILDTTAPPVEPHTIRRWLNGWRRLWIVWALFCVLFANVLATQAAYRPLNDLYDAKFAHTQEAEAKAAQRKANAPLFSRLRNGGPDPELADDLAWGDRQFDPQIADKRAALNIDWIKYLIGYWFALAGGAYAAGATLAWIRRGFSQASERQPAL